MSKERFIGQHHSSGSSLTENSGQKTRIRPEARVGQPSGGEKNNGAVPAGKVDGDIRTQSHVSRGHEPHKGVK